MGTEYQTGVEREEVKWIFEENGEHKFYSVPIKDKNGELHYLIQRMAEVELLDDIVLEAKKKGIRTYIDVMVEEIPVAEEEPTNI